MTGVTQTPSNLCFYSVVGPKTGSRGAGRGFKRCLEAVGFILAKFEPKPSHGDPIRDQNYGFGTFDIITIGHHHHRMMMMGMMMMVLMMT